MIEVGWLILGLGSILFLWGSKESRRELRSGVVSYASIADLTGIFDRKELERIFGAPDASDSYRVDTNLEGLPRGWWKLVDNDAIEWAILVASFIGISSTATWEAHLVLLLLAFQIGSSVACAVLLAIHAK
ncbi:MAG: hypothetical protein K2Y37_06360 [Pirellulales bacterium]|nr:hypothetical protein [Pirellulales bacterium]